MNSRIIVRMMHIHPTLGTKIWHWLQGLATCITWTGAWFADKIFRCHLEQRFLRNHNWETLPKTLLTYRTAFQSAHDPNSLVVAHNQLRTWLEKGTEDPNSDTAKHPLRVTLNKENNPYTAALINYILNNAPSSDQEAPIDMNFWVTRFFAVADSRGLTAAQKCMNGHTECFTPKNFEPSEWAFNTALRDQTSPRTLRLSGNSALLHPTKAFNDVDDEYANAFIDAMLAQHRATAEHPISAKKSAEGVWQLIQDGQPLDASHIFYTYFFALSQGFQMQCSLADITSQDRGVHKEWTVDGQGMETAVILEHNADGGKTVRLVMDCVMFDYEKRMNPPRGALGQNVPVARANIVTTVHFRADGTEASYTTTLAWRPIGR